MFSPTTIADVREKCKSLVARVPRDLLIIAILLLASLLSFGFGYLAGRDAGQGSTLTITESPLATLPPVTNSMGSLQARQVVASKNGTKYYLPECSGADRISASNKVWFASAAAAARAGYTPAANCLGL